MTADRSWVRFVARWLARIDGVKGQVQMFSLAVTAFSTFSLMLQGFGLGEAVPYVGIAAVVVGTAYTYLYTEGGVWNQVGRDRNDMSNNFTDPDMLLMQRISAQQFAMLAHLLADDVDFETAREQMVAKTEGEWRDLRDGIDVEE